MALSLCIVGCGVHARSVLDVIHNMTEDFRLFFASRDPDRAREYCETYGGVDFFGSYEQAAADPRVEAMYFLTPHHIHLENTLLASRNSKHVLMEKPIARTVAEATEMVQAMNVAGIRLMIAENYRFLPTVERCKQILGQGVIGGLRLIQIWDEDYSEPTGWRVSSANIGGGLFIDGGIHSVDMLVNLGGFPERVYAVKPPKVFGGGEEEDGLVLTAHLPGGAVGFINFSYATPAARPRQGVTVTGTQGEITFAPHGTEITVDTLDHQRMERLPEGQKGLRGMMLEFKDSVDRDREPSMSGLEGLKDLLVVLGAYESADQGRVAILDLPGAAAPLPSDD